VSDDDYGLAAADSWVATRFPDVPDRDRHLLVQGIASILYPHAAVAAISDMADEMADRWPDIGAALDQAAAARRTELARGESRT
jgi:hypothetical protein